MRGETLQIALAIIRHPQAERYLIAQRPGNVHLPDLWEFPGGKCAGGEDPAACAVREASEETGLQVMILEAWPLLVHAYPERTVKMHPFLCRAATADASPLASRAIVWATPDELTQYAFPAANAPLIERLQASSLEESGSA